MAAKRIKLPLMKYLRVQVDTLPSNYKHRFGSLPLILRFYEEVRGSFLDKSEVTDRIITCVKNFQKVNASKVTPSSHIQNDLGLDSLDAVKIVMALEEEFGFEILDNEVDKINSIKLVVDFSESHPQAKLRNL